MTTISEYRLFNEFRKIRNKGWIKSLRKGSTGIGYTLETLLKIPENSFAIPDFCGIEIKAMRILSKKRIHLFNAEPDGDFLFPHERILEKIGYPSKKNKNYKVFLSAAYGNEYIKLGYSRKIKVSVNRSQKKLEFLAKDKYGNDIDLNVSWSFELLQSKLENKINEMAIIRTDNKYICEEEYFYYRWIEFYKNKGFETFLDLLDNGIIKVCFKIGVYYSGVKEGKIDNHGTDFSIKEKDIEKLFTKIDIFNKVDSSLE